ncbi:MAG TPA: glycoside hydrolase family 9 protein, partial [Polyangiaceae bacterium]|nr:glycoside hydrolase family 9 protein [Polyangiaceae bacterium]
MNKRGLSFGAWFAVSVGASALLSGCSSGSGTPGGGGAAPIGGSPSSGGNASSGGASNSNAGTGAVQPGAGNGGSTAQGGQTAGGGVGNAGVGNAGVGNAGAGSPPGGTAGDWKVGLTQGPNGLIPWIVVDQFGYRAQDPKVALLRDPRQGYDAATDFTPGASYALVDAKTGAKVKQGAPQAWNNGAVDPKSGDAVWSFDFSDVTALGTYYVLDEQTGRRSPEFEIGPGVYRNVLRHAMRTFFYQRAGFEKKAEFAGAEWADAASHLQPGQDGETHDWLDKTNAAKVKDLRGGWYDAGDYNKYTSWHARYLITLLRSFVRHPAVFGDDSGIPESGNGTPDVLDEVKFGLDWLARMQNEDGSLLCVQTLGSGSPPSSAKDPSYYGPPTTAATLAGAAAFAYAARVFSARSEASLKQAAEDYVARAKKAWTFADGNPSLTYFNN